ncbi:MAG: hypothetical protein ACAI34_08535, partial [Verrucomicrobium sp.]
MSTRSFAITASASEISLNPDGKATAAFTVTNTSPRPVRGQVRVTPLGSTDPSWLKLQGPDESNFNSSESRQVVVDISPTAGAAPGKHSFRLDICATTNPDDDFTQGPATSVIIAATPAAPAPPKPFPLWILLVILAVVLAGGAFAVSQLLKKPDAPSFLVRVGHSTGIDPETVMFNGTVEVPGVLKPDTEMELVGMHDSIKGKVIKVKKNGLDSTDLLTNDIVSITMKVPSTAAFPGRVLAFPGKVTAHKRIKAKITFTEPLLAALRENKLLNFDIRAYLNGKFIDLPDGIKSGETKTVTLELTLPVVTAKGREFEIYEGDPDSGGTLLG